MSKGTVNKVILVGRMGADPEVRYMPNGTAVATLRMATNDGYKDKQSGQFVETTEWHRVVLFGRLAEIAGQYLSKGRLVYIEGRIRTTKWQDKAGQDRYTTEIVANEMQLLGGSGNGGREEIPQGENVKSTANEFNQEPAVAEASTSGPAPKAQDFDKFQDDDIPF